MRKPNKSLKLMAMAIKAHQSAVAAKSSVLRAHYTKRATNLFKLAASASDAERAIRIIHASNADAENQELDAADDDENLPIKASEDADEVDSRAARALSAASRARRRLMAHRRLFRARRED